MRRSLATGYRIDDLKEIPVPKDLGDYVIRPSRVNPEVLVLDAPGIVIRPSLTVRGVGSRPWIYLKGDLLCVDGLCREVPGILSAVPVSERSFIATTREGVKILEVGEDLRARKAGGLEVLGSASYVDRFVVLLRSSGLVRRLSAIDQGYRYEIQSYCLDRREAHTLVALREKGQGSRIYFGADFGGYTIHETRARVVRCSIGHRVATVGLERGGSIYLGRGLHLEAPLASDAVAWDPEEEVLILYDEGSRWLIRNDLRSFKPAARLETRPSYLGKVGDAHLFTVHGVPVAVRGSTLVRPELGAGGALEISSSSHGVVLDLGERLEIRDLEGRLVRSISKKPSARCWGYGNKILCVSRHALALVDVDNDDPVVVDVLEDLISVLRISRKGVLRVELAGDLVPLKISGSDGEVAVDAAPRVFKERAGALLLVEDFLGTHAIRLELRPRLPKLSVVDPLAAVADAGISKACRSPGLLRAAIVLEDAAAIGELYDLKAHVRRGEKILGRASLKLEGESSDLLVCLDEDPGEGPVTLDLVASLKGEGGEVDPPAFLSTSVPVTRLSPSISSNISHGVGESVLRVRAEIEGKPVERMEVRILCSNASFRKGSEGSGDVVLTIRGCEVPSKIRLEVEHGGFSWVSEEPLDLAGLAECSRNHMERGMLVASKCSEGGFYANLEPLSHRDRSPLRDLRVTVAQEGAAILILSLDWDASHGLRSLDGQPLRAGFSRQGPRRVVVIEDPRPGEAICLWIFSGGVYREYLVRLPGVEEMLAIAVRTSYKMLGILGGLLHVAGREKDPEARWEDLQDPLRLREPGDR